MNKNKYAPSTDPPSTTLEHTQIRGEGVTPIETKQQSTGKPKGRTVAKDFYQIPTRDKSGEIINTTKRKCVHSSKDH